MFRALRSVLRTGEGLANESHPTERRINYARLYSFPEMSTLKRVGLLGPALGAPAAVLACEPLLASGTGHIVFLGFGGAIAKTKQLRIGDVVLVTSSMNGTGAGASYHDTTHLTIQPSVLGERLSTGLHSLVNSSKDFSIVQGTVWSTDSPYRTTMGTLDDLSAKGVVLVDMELSAIAALSVKYNREFSAIMIVTDLLSDSWEQGFHSPRVATSTQLVCEHLAHVLENYYRETLSAS